MADIPSNNPTPGASASDPMKKSTGKVQPKKETVRINLPPKPTAAPTIKLPTLPPGGPTGASTGLPAAAALPRTAAAAPVATRAAAPAVSQRPAPVIVAAPTISALDKVLALAACITALAAVGTTVWMLMLLNGAITQ
jgi:hypothetical protein